MTDFISKHIKKTAEGITLQAYEPEQVGHSFNHYLVLAFFVSIGIFMIAMAILAPIYQSEPTVLWIIFELVMVAGILFWAAFVAWYATKRRPVSTEWCNTRRTITYRFHKGIRAHRYTFSYEDFLGFRINEWSDEDSFGDEDSSGLFLQMGIRLGAGGEAGAWREGKPESASGRKFILSRAQGWWGPLREPIAWIGGRAAARQSPPPRWIRTVAEAIASVRGEPGIGCELFDLLPDHGFRQDVVDAIKAISDATGLAPAVPREYLPPD